MLNPITDEGLSFDDVLIIPHFSNITSRSEITLLQKTSLDTVLDIPIISANMDTITGEDMLDAMDSFGGMGILHRYMSVKDMEMAVDRWRVSGYGKIAISVGCLAKDKDRINSLIQKFDKDEIIICIDIAHGHSKNMKDTLYYIRKAQGFEGSIIAGNVCTPQATRDLLHWGADMIKVGVGPGSACTTRLKTGCGFPQFTTIQKCSTVGPIIADGGIRSPGDAAKALAAGAELVMVGGMLAGTDRTPQWNENEPFVEFRGMASKAARTSYEGVSKNAEGISCTVEAKPVGSTEAVINELVEGIKSSMSYAGLDNLADFRTKTTFVKTTSAIINENRPHILEII